MTRLKKNNQTLSSSSFKIKSRRVGGIYDTQSGPTWSILAATIVVLLSSVLLTKTEQRGALANDRFESFTSFGKEWLISMLPQHWAPDSWWDPHLPRHFLKWNGCPKEEEQLAWFGSSIFWSAMERMYLLLQIKQQWKASGKQATQGSTRSCTRWGHVQPTWLIWFTQS